MKANLEERIITDIYRFESKRTIGSLIKYFVLLAVVVAVVVALGDLIYTILLRQQTLDLLQLFNEDWETIESNFFDVANVFFMELPRFLSLVLGSFLFVLLLTAISLWQNFPKLSKRLKVIRKYFSERR